MEKFNVQVNLILATLKSKLSDHFGKNNLDRKTVLQLAKELGYLQGKRGRDGGTFATETGMTFANLSGEIIKPAAKKSLTVVTDCPVACMTPEQMPTVVATSEVP